MVLSQNSEIYSLYGNQLEAVIYPSDEELNKYDWHWVEETNRVYDDSMSRRLKETEQYYKDKTIRTGYCFHSWKYLQKHRSDILRIFEFPAEVKESASQQITLLKSNVQLKYQNIWMSSQYLNESFPITKENLHSKSIVYVAVHVRRTDYVGRLGADTPGSEFLWNTTLYFLHKYKVVCKYFKFSTVKL